MGCKKGDLIVLNSARPIYYSSFLGQKTYFGRGTTFRIDCGDTMYGFIGISIPGINKPSTYTISPDNLAMWFDKLECKVTKPKLTLKDLLSEDQKMTE